MEISVAVIKIAVLALPGLIASQIYRKLRGRRRKEAWESLSEILVFAISSYAVWLVIYRNSSWLQSHLPRFDVTISTVTTQSTSAQPPATGMFSTAPTKTPTNVDAISSAIFDEKSSPQWAILFLNTILPATALGVSFAYLASLVHFKKPLNRFANCIRFSHRPGDEDGWEYFFDTLTPPWVLVRDHKLDRAYYGQIHFFSETAQDRELILLNVQVTNNSTGQTLYYLQKIYLSRKNDDLTLEFRITGEDSVAQPLLKKEKS
jgi:hypothetical protein